jgi:drug/metabolite transporter (DMT)-like permease
VDSNPLGLAAGLGTAVCWAFSSAFFTFAGRRVGSVFVNRARLALAVVLTAITHAIIVGGLFPMHAEPYRYGWLALSGIIGLVIGDSFLFQSYVLVGARLGVLLLSLSPIFSAVLSGLILGETLRPVELAGMMLALSGVCWVVLERGAQKGSGERAVPERDYFLGLLFGVGAAFCQSLNFVVAKKGIAGDFPALSGVLIRMTAATIVMWAIAAFQGQVGKTIRSVNSDAGVRRAVISGTVVGPFIGIWLSFIAVQTTRVGIASTLIAMTPIASLPVVRFYFHERVSPRALLGTFVAMAGVAVMILG